MDPGRRLYAVGDIHGREDLLDRLLALIAEDCAKGDAFDGKPILVFLGDYIDRGLASRACLERLIALDEAAFELRFLKGNHEAALLSFLVTPERGEAWLSFGGAETLFSYGVPAPKQGAGAEALGFAARALKAAMPPAHIAFLQRLELAARYGDYLFVHAGLRPGRPLNEQAEDDLLSIREPFLSAKSAWPFTVVHGHTPRDGVERAPGRIGVDTGAYVTGKLSAVRLQGDHCAVLAT
jgi:serine/threonine protein phosphatase 1